MTNFPVMDKVTINGEEQLILESHVFRDFFYEVSQYQDTDPEVVDFLVNQFNKFDKIKKQRIRNKKVKQCICVMYKLLFYPDKKEV